MIEVKHLEESLNEYGIPSIVATSVKLEEDILLLLEKGIHAFVIETEDDMFAIGNDIISYKQLFDLVYHFSIRNRQHFPVILYFLGGNPQVIEDVLLSHDLYQNLMTPNHLKVSQTHSSGVFEWPIVKELGGKVLVATDGSHDRDLVFSSGVNDPFISFTADHVRKPGLLRRFFVLSDPFEIYKREIKRAALKNQLRIVHSTDLKQFSKTYENYLRLKQVNITAGPTIPKEMVIHRL